MKVKKNPRIAAVLNFVLPGLGYLYAGKKHVIVSLSFFILSVWVAFHDWSEITGILSGRMGISEHFLLFIVLYPFIFAFDAYRDAVKN